MLSCKLPPAHPANREQIPTTMEMQTCCVEKKNSPFTPLGMSRMSVLYLSVMNDHDDDDDDDDEDEEEEEKFIYIYSIRSRMRFHVRQIAAI